MKITGTFTLALFIILVIFVFFISAPMLNKMSDCLTQATEQFKVIDKEAANKEQFCLNAKQLLLDLSSCYKRIENTYLIPTSVWESVVKIRKPGALSLRESIEIHNRDCANIPDAIIY